MTAAIAFLSGSWKWLAICAACIALGYLRGCSDGRAAVENEYAQARLLATEHARESDAVAADQRAIDTETIRNESEARNDAIEQAPNSAPDAANHALGCERLRQAGIAPIPASC
tara:strand:+ start:9120 stop:9461 length:342 start_codon:yes stop_codon:yes gene_type:complete